MEMGEPKQITTEPRLLDEHAVPHDRVAACEDDVSEQHGQDPTQPLRASDIRFRDMFTQAPIGIALIATRWALAGREPRLDRDVGLYRGGTAKHHLSSVDTPRGCGDGRGQCPTTSARRSRLVPAREALSPQTGTDDLDPGASLLGA